MAEGIEAWRRASRGAVVSRRLSEVDNEDDPRAAEELAPLAAAAALAVQARRQPGPRECARAAADLIRLGQDFTVGRRLRGMLTGAQIQRLGLRAMLGCGLEREPEEAREAATLLERLSAEAPTLGTRFQEAALHRQRFMRGTLQQARPHADPRALEHMLEDWAFHQRVLPQLAALRHQNYPKAFEELDAIRRQIEENGAGVTLRQAPLYHGQPFLRADADLHARLRAAALALRRAGGEAAAGKQPGLSDPYTGRGLRVEGREVRSAGPDGEMDSEDDVVVVLPTGRGGRGTRSVTSGGVR